MRLASGVEVTSKVRLVEQLGVGGMGSVWIADHRTLETQVAVKFIDPDLIKKHPTILKRFRREASAAAQIQSPHVVRIFDHGETEDGSPYIVMELLQGESLGERLERAGTLGIDEMTQVLTQTAKALRKAHKAGIVHRDLKPDNIFLVGSGTQDEQDELFAGELFVKILDFGIAKQPDIAGQSVMTMAGALIGTPEYMSPEQILSAKDVDAQADLWALAVVTYQALTGRVPFTGETLGAIWNAVTAAEFLPPSQLREDVNVELDEWFATALERDRAKRFPSISAMALAFAHAVASRPSRTDLDPAQAIQDERTMRLALESQDLEEAAAVDGVFDGYEAGASPAAGDRAEVPIERDAPRKPAFAPKPTPTAPLPADLQALVAGADADAPKTTVPWRPGKTTPLGETGLPPSEPEPRPAAPPAAPERAGPPAAGEEARSPALVSISDEPTAKLPTEPGVVPGTFSGAAASLDREPSAKRGRVIAFGAAAFVLAVGVTALLLTRDGGAGAEARDSPTAMAVPAGPSGAQGGAAPASGGRPDERPPDTDGVSADSDETSVARAETSRAASAPVAPAKATAPPPAAAQPPPTRRTQRPASTFAPTGPTGPEPGGTSQPAIAVDRDSPYAR